ncbi:Uncharacterized membrane protein YfcC, ion transporter superfamily [Ignavigranum ruoffiae]|uniref:Uncharacterized membrane protein YfcC, ion transporter superfamily n=1 Tax=Ignavigranum ruoffiae TaxID=89093 RepID=A0A1H9B3J6_9LACT|nr:YfcC family protein [Ignavigranum ruoffiae]SEP83612.1 Uncharacterized membrane protein YfcC, ion transporter superfamily [Ignavigranum ruoffiae]
MESKEEKTKKKKFKSPNSYVVIFSAIVLVAILTWFIPGGAYKLNEAGQAISGTYEPTQANQQGLWNILMAPIIGMVGNESVSAAITISLNVMLFGSFLEMMDETEAVKKSLKKIAFKFKDNIYILITVLTFMMGIFGTVQGAYEEGFVYVLMFLPIMLNLGLDTITTLMIVIFGTQMGCAASIVNPFSTGIASGILGISPGDGILIRAVIFIILLSLTSLLICMYAKKVKSDPKNSVQYYRLEKDKEEFTGENVSENNELTKEQNWVFRIFILTFIIMIISLVPWVSLNENFTIFQDIANWINTNPISKIIIGNNVVPLGDWYFNEINVLLIVMTLISGTVMGYSIDKSINILVRGAGALVSTAFIVPLARGIQVIMTDGNITATILHYAETTLGSFSPIVFILLAFLVYLIMASFIPSSTGLAAATISIMGPLGLFAGVSQVTMIILYNFALGIVKAIMPTSIIVMTCTQAVHVDYATWVKVALKYILILAAVSAIILLILVNI